MAPLLCRPADRTLGPLNTHFFPLLEMSIRNNDFSNGSLVVCWFSFGGVLFGCVLFFYIFLFPPFFVSSPLWWSAPNASCNDVFIDSFAFPPLCFRFFFAFFGEKKQKGIKRRMVSNYPNFSADCGDMCAPPLWSCCPDRVRDYPLRLRQSEGPIDFHLVSARVCRMLPPSALLCFLHDWNQSPSIHPSVGLVRPTFSSLSSSSFLVVVVVAVLSVDVTNW